MTRVPRTCAVRQELEHWGQQQPSRPVVLEKPGRTRPAAPRRWRGQSITRCVDVEYADGRRSQAAIRFVVVHSSPLAQPEAKAAATAHAKEAERVADHITRVEAKQFACIADAEAAIADDEGRRPGRRGRRPQLWRSHVLRYHVEAFTRPQKRTRRGRPPKDETPLEAIASRLRVEAQPLERAEADNGWTVLATTIAAEVCSDAQIVHAYQEQHSTVEQGFRWIKNPAAIAPVWLEKPERIAALAMLTVVGLLVYTLLQRQVRLYLQRQQQQLPGNKGPTAAPTAAVVLALFAQVMLVQIHVDTTETCQVYGFQEHHGMVCDALRVDRSWYGLSSTQQNSPMSTTPP